jgi:Skp family chaperone for outer membrane proteins
MRMTQSIRLALASFALAAIALAQPATAQDAAVRVAVANPSKILSMMLETADLKKADAGEVQKLREQEEAKGKEIQAMKEQRDKFSKRGTPDYEKQTSDLIQKSVDARVWAEVQQAHLTRRNKEELRNLYNKIQAAVAQIAQERKLDLVLTDFGGDIPEDLDPITPERLQQIIQQKSVLFAGKNADISDDVIARLNAAYKAGAGASGK